MSSRAQGSKNAGTDERQADVYILREAYREYSKMFRSRKPGMTKLISERDVLDKWAGKVRVRALCLAPTPVLKKMSFGSGPDVRE